MYFKDSTGKRCQNYQEEISFFWYLPVLITLGRTAALPVSAGTTCHHWASHCLSQNLMDTTVLTFQSERTDAGPEGRVPGSIQPPGQPSASWPTEAPSPHCHCKCVPLARCFSSKPCLQGEVATRPGSNEGGIEGRLLGAFVSCTDGRREPLQE